MGPLVPTIIGNEFNLLIGLFIGFAFGFILEQAGFSTTKKLVGLFYGYDFTVLKVFFTAGITAMIGIVALAHWDLIDLNMIYINPTFLWSAIVGGAIMGLGFIIGGFCPGTSVCAASIGKVDAMFFLLGSFIGILIFGEMYPAFEKLYLAKNLGAARIDKIMGISSELFAFLMSLMAVAAFYFTQKIENNVNKIKTEISKSQRNKYIALAVLPFIILLFITILPSQDEVVQKRIADAKEQKKCVFHEINADKLLTEMINNYYKINLIDVRSPEAYSEYHIPLAINIPLDSIFNRDFENYFKQTYKKNIFYADQDTIVKMACLSAKHIGKSDNMILNISTTEFRNIVYNIENPGIEATKQEHNLFHFRKDAGEKLLKLDQVMNKFNTIPVKTKVNKLGGCS